MPELDDYADDQGELTITKVGGQDQEAPPAEDRGDAAPQARPRSNGMMTQGQS